MNRLSRPTPRTPPRLTERVREGLIVWLIRHLQVFFATLGKLVKSPFGTLMTGAVIGIALALPAGLSVMLDNARAIGKEWNAVGRISLFLESDKSNQEARALAGELRKRADIGEVTVITREAALEEYRRLSGFAEVLDLLNEENPLPPVLVLHPLPDAIDPNVTETLLATMRKRDEVAIAQLDLQWLKRLYFIMEIARRGLFAVAVLLALGVLLIIGNTIRLSVQNQREEIEIARLFGASDAFIRRPFLYTGLWYGLLGAAIAWVFVGLAFGLLQGPANQLAALYHSDLPVISLSGKLLFQLLAVGGILGVLGSRISVGRHLKSIEPS